MDPGLAEARQNRLLAGLPDADLVEIARLLEPYEATERTQVHAPGSPIDHVYFPLSAVFSLVAGIGTDTIEVGTIGREGMVGLPVFLGSASSPNTAFCQVPGSSLRMRAVDLADFLNKADGTLHSRLHRYTQAMLVQIAQSVACNQMHRIEQRAARWLLMTRDRVGADTFPITQRFLAQMLGVRRASVSAVASRLQAAGYITYVRGVLTVVDGTALEETTCECYRVVQDEFDQLL